MDQGGIGSSQLPLHPDYDESEQQDSFDDFTTHAQHAVTYANPGVDLRRDAPPHGDINSLYQFTAANTPRYPLPTAGIAPDPGSFRPAQGFGEGVPPSIPPHTSSPESIPSYTFNSYGAPPPLPVLYPTLQPPSFYGPQSLRLGGATHVPESVPLHVRPLRLTDASSIPRAGAQYGPFTANRSGSYGSAFAPLLEHGRAVQFDTFPPAPEQEREQELLPTIPRIPRPPPQHMRRDHLQDDRLCPFPQMSQDRVLLWRDREITAQVWCTSRRGIFANNKDRETPEWTCYRRNYFDIEGYFLLEDFPDGGDLYVVVNGRRELIKSFGLAVTASVSDGSTTPGKPIEIVQHTAKRDAGPKTKVETIKVSPSRTHEEHHNHGPSFSPSTLSGAYPQHIYPGPNLAYQDEPDPLPQPASNNSKTEYDPTAPPAPPPNGMPTGRQTFIRLSRLQFKCATANNGKRRASQQYFRLRMSLMADIRPLGSNVPEWVEVAYRQSDQVVVRGRSPSHYQTTDRGTNGGNGGRARSVSTASPYALPTGLPSQYGNLQSTGGRAAHHTGYGGHMNAPPGHYRPAFQPYDGGDPVTSMSPLELTGGGYPPSGHLGETHPGHLDPGHYRYFPTPIYETNPHPSGRLQQLPIPKAEESVHMPSDPGNFAGRRDYPSVQPGIQWQHAPPLERFDHAESSVDHYPYHLHSDPEHVAGHNLPSVVEEQEDEEEHEPAHHFQ